MGFIGLGAGILYAFWIDQPQAYIAYDVISPNPKDTSHAPKTAPVKLAVIFMPSASEHSEVDEALKQLPIHYAILPNQKVANQIPPGFSIRAIPMEPFGYPSEDPGPDPLMTGIPPEKNLERFHRHVHTLPTSYLIPYMGERFMASKQDLDPFLKALSSLKYTFLCPPGDAKFFHACKAHNVSAIQVDFQFVLPHSYKDVRASLAALSQLSPGFYSLVLSPHKEHIAALKDGLTRMKTVEVVSFDRFLERNQQNKSGRHVFRSTKS